MNLELKLLSALRETAVLMAAFIGHFAFKEKLTAVSVGATAVETLGIVMLRL